MNKELAKKKTLSIFCPSKDFSLGYADLLVYCHRADQFRFDTVPSIRRTAKATGLQEKTVTESDQRLQEHGLITPEKAVINPCPRLGWFQPLDKLKELFPDGPPFQWLQNWKTLVRQPGDNPLTLPCVLVYSLIRHSHETKWKPAQGWTHEYIALLTATNTKTVAAAIGRLEENGFLKVQDGMRFGFYRLRDSQLACFADKKAWSGNSAEPDEFIEDFGPGSERLELRQKTKAAITNYLTGLPISDKAKDAIYAKVIKQEGWERMGLAWTKELADRFI